MPFNPLRINQLVLEAFALVLIAPTVLMEVLRNSEQVLVALGVIGNAQDAPDIGGVQNEADHDSNVIDISTRRQLAAEARTTIGRR
ncbi:MAG: hypothetical protein JWR32_1437 [Mycobacterium sp.]|jgi:hypothetical protein|nr:hypothetical protein [Mycobacterium sp.]